jgi:adenine-specific DNA-methyltransferase
MISRSHLQKSFKRPYDRILFGKDVLSQIFGSGFSFYNNLVPVSEQPNQTEQIVIKSIFIYGKITLDDGTEINCYEVTLNDSVRIEQSKVAIQNYVRKLLTAGQAALINFISLRYNKTWRLTLVAKDSELIEGSIKEKATHPKRYTFLIEIERENRTVAERLEILSSEPNIDLTALTKAFSVERMSDEFFKEYKDHYQNFVQYLTGKRIVQEGKKYVEIEISKPSGFLKTIFNGNDRDARDFCKKLLGRIIFLYFLQKKRWLGATTLDYEDGNQDFISELFKETGSDDNFFPLGLTPLFFEALNESRKDDNFITPSGKKVKIPYLNGGLFTRDDTDKLLEKKKNIMTFPATLFANRDHEDIPFKRGFLDFLNSYNFTVYEDGPNDHTIAVDPEMLGHIFENLLEDNKDKGTFYTPKEVVVHMSQISLIEYFRSHSGIDSNGIEVLVKEKDPSRLSFEQLEKVEKWLDEIKICDPAIGSGAFPVGLLHEIFTIKEIITYTLKKDWQPAKAKENIIQNSIYGVDIEKGAVDIARLRFWLSLVVDIEKPKALPNLDYKIVVGNSLIGKFKDKPIEIDWEIKEGTQIDVFGEGNLIKRQELLKLISSKQKDYYQPEKTNKNSLPQEIRDLKIELLKNQLDLMIKRDGIKAKPKSDVKKYKELLKKYDQTKSWIETIEELDKIKANPQQSFEHFDWKLDFPEVLNPILNIQERGFDIVIENPPWGAIMSKETEAIIKEKNKDIIVRMTDSFMFFINECFNLAKPNGIITHIIPEVVLNQQDNTELRKKIFTEKTVESIINLGDGVFEGVTRACCILQLKNSPSIKNYYDVMDFVRDEKKKLKFLNSGVRVEKSLVEKLPNFIFPTQQIELYKLIEVLKDTTLLKNYVDDDGIQRGVSPDYQDAFIVTEEQIAIHSLEKNFLKKTVTGGKEVKRYSLESHGKSVIYTSKETPSSKIPNIISYISSFKSKITCSEVKQGKHPFYALHRSRDENIFLKDSKILGVITGDKISVNLDLERIYPTDGIYVLSTGNLLTDKFLVGVLNSKFVTALYRLYSNEKGKILAQIKPMVLELVPIPMIKDGIDKLVASFVDHILFLKHQDLDSIQDKLIPAYFEQIVDAIVYELYFPDLLKQHDRQIIKHLHVLPELKTARSNKEKLMICREVFQTLNDKTHAVRNNIFYLNSIPQIAMIEDQNENNRHRDN